MFQALWTKIWLVFLGTRRITEIKTRIRQIAAAPFDGDDVVVVVIVIAKDFMKTNIRTLTHRLISNLLSYTNTLINAKREIPEVFNRKLQFQFRSMFELFFLSVGHMSLSIYFAVNVFVCMFLCTREFFKVFCLCCSLFLEVFVYVYEYFL